VIEIVVVVVATSPVVVVVVVVGVVVICYRKVQLFQKCVLEMCFCY